jgi:hypothetical protein
VGSGRLQGSGTRGRHHTNLPNSSGLEQCKLSAWRPECFQVVTPAGTVPVEAAPAAATLPLPATAASAPDLGNPGSAWAGLGAFSSSGASMGEYRTYHSKEYGYLAVAAAQPVDPAAQPAAAAADQRALAQVAPGVVCLNPRLCSLMVRKWSTRLHSRPHADIPPMTEAVAEVAAAEPVVPAEVAAAEPVVPAEVAAAEPVVPAEVAAAEPVVPAEVAAAQPVVPAEVAAAEPVVPAEVAAAEPVVPAEVAAAEPVVPAAPVRVRLPRLFAEGQEGSCRVEPSSSRRCLRVWS